MSDKSSKSGFIVVVDDDPDTIIMMERYLKRLGYKSRAAQGGEQALDLLRKDPKSVGLVLLDMAMPGMSGYEVCNEIRADAKLKELPVVALTASVEGKLLEQARESGVDDILAKPFTREALQIILKEHIR